MVVGGISEFLHSLVQLLLRPEFIEVGALVLQGIEIPLHWRMSYGYPALLMLWDTWTDPQNSMKAFDVYWLPWSLCRTRLPSAGRWDSNAFCSVRIASSLVIWRSVMLAATLLSWRSMMVQL